MHTIDGPQSSLLGVANLSLDCGDTNPWRLHIWPIPVSVDSLAFPSYWMVLTFNRSVYDLLIAGLDFVFLINCGDSSGDMETVGL